MVAFEGEIKEWSFGWIFGSSHPFFVVNAKTILHTWVVLIVLLIIAIPIRWIMRKKDSALRQMILSYIQSFLDLFNQSVNEFSFNHFCFILSLFTFIFACNSISLIPTFEEPTTDLNTTLGLGIASFLYIQAASIAKLGLLTYIKEYFAPFFLMFPIHVIGKLASIMSISFRLFGNIFGSALIMQIYMHTIRGWFIGELFGLVTGLNIILALFFGIFEGFLQAFVFAMLSLTYLSIALSGEEHG